jgi:2-keto-3-deoxy-L-rhamnonate aldolase RhmA
VIAACDAAVKSVGLLLVRPTLAAVQRTVADGYNLLCIGIDTVFLDQGARAARALALSALDDASSLKQSNECSS